MGARTTGDGGFPGAVDPRLLVRDRTVAVLAAGAERLRRWPPAAVIAVFVLVEWLAVAALALTVRHDGWVYYQGGDQLWYYTLGWLIGHGQLTQTVVGYGWSLLLAPLSLVFGPSLVAALPAIVLLNVLVLLPAAIAALYGLAARIGGRLFGYWTLLLWLLVPFFGIWYTNAGYHQRYTELTLPASFGLTALADFPNMVAVLVSLYFCARVATDRASLLSTFVDGAAAGAAAGIAVAIKPSSALFLAGPALMFFWTQRFAAMGAFGAAMLPALGALAVWKARGLGNIPVLGAGAPHGGGLAAVSPVVGLDLGRYFGDLSWSNLTTNVDQLREHFWSGRLLVWIVFAGLIGLGRRSRWAALLLGGALLPLTLVKASYTYAQVADASVFRLLMPCFPIFVVLVASLPLLVPGVPGRLAPWRPAWPESAPRRRLGVLAVTIVVSGIVPLAAFAAADVGAGGVATAAIVNPSSVSQTPVPIDVGSVTPSARVSHRRVILDWRRQEPHGRVFYRVWRSAAATGGLTCQTSPGARWCTLGMRELGVTADTAFIDKPRRGRWTYRIAVAANWLGDPHYGDVYFASRPITILVR